LGIFNNLSVFDIFIYLNQTLNLTAKHLSNMWGISAFKFKIAGKLHSTT